MRCRGGGVPGAEGVGSGSMLKTADAPMPITAKQLEARDRDRLARANESLAALEAAKAPFTVATVLAPLNERHVELSNISAEAGIYTARHPDRDARHAAERLHREPVDIAQRAPRSHAIAD